MKTEAHDDQFQTASCLKFESASGASCRRALRNEQTLSQRVFTHRECECMSASREESDLTPAPGGTGSLVAIRAYELHQVLALIPLASRVLEIGAGAGWQSKELTRHGHAVSAIDVEGSNYAEVRVWPVQEYDGFHIPFPDGTFDVVFSSNTLEHIQHVEEFQGELARVLSPDGFAVHILPTGSWRWWSIITHYPFVIRTALRYLGIGSTRGAESATAVSRARSRNTSWALTKKILLAPRHGERGNALSEVWLFSKLRWCRLFEKSGWSVERTIPLHLFYTGYEVLAESLTIPQRQSLSQLLGSSTIAYVLRPADRLKRPSSTCDN